mmetsp:Transcript_130436/g.260253  ORF Transcript_130436/g.260253 Transcript_130436/m.260253 type:complete len:343 (-) Transcript_130436:38-1066(-)
MVGPQEARCYVCNLPGHYARNCPSEHRLSCHVCGESTGHLARDCPHARHSSLALREVFLCTRAAEVRATHMTSQQLENAWKSRCQQPHTRCFSRRIVLFAPGKVFKPQYVSKDPEQHVLTGKSSANKRIRLDMVAQLAIHALFLGHSVRDNTVFDIWAKEGYYRISTSREPPIAERADVLTIGAPPKLAYTERGMMSYLQSDWVRPLWRFVDGDGSRDEFLNMYFPIAPPGPMAVCLSEDAEVQLEDLFSAWDSKSKTMEEVAAGVCDHDCLDFLEQPIFLGDHDGEDCGAEFLKEALPDGWGVISARLGMNSLLGSACMAILHHIMDKYHVCPLKAWPEGC